VSNIEGQEIVNVTQEGGRQWERESGGKTKAVINWKKSATAQSKAKSWRDSVMGEIVPTKVRSRKKLQWSRGKTK